LQSKLPAVINATTLLVAFFAENLLMGGNEAYEGVSLRNNAMKKLLVVNLET